MYQDVYRYSIDSPEAFWTGAAEDIYWVKKWDKVIDDSQKPLYRWFVGGELNMCYNAVDRHVENGRGEQIALIYDSPVTGTIKAFSYIELCDQAARFAGVLAEQGITKGDRVIIYMPMVPEAVVAMLACARIGAIHSVVFGGFVARELAARIDDAKPKLIVSASCGIEVKRVIDYGLLLNEAIEISNNKPEHCIILQRPQNMAVMKAGRDLDWHEAIADAKPVNCVPVSATDPLYILYTSGTTGQPKGVVRDTGGYAVALQWSMKNVYDMGPGEVWWTASDVGWVVGHSYIVYAPLLNGNTTVIYEGKPVSTPDAGAFWRVISQHRVKGFFTAPTAIRAIKREDPRGNYCNANDLSSLRTVFLAGERCDSNTLKWVNDILKVPVIDNWWQTETGWPIVSNCMGIEKLPIRPGSPAVPVPGFNVQVLDMNGSVKTAGESDNIAVKLPLPPGCLPTLWNADGRYKETYLKTYPGYYLTWDAGYQDEDGYFWIMGRIDDIINTAGHRLSTGAIEEVIASHPDVAECAVIGVADELKGELSLGLVVLKDGVKRSHEEIAAEIIKLVKNNIGPVAAFKKVAMISNLPKTRSGKVLRSTMRKIADGVDYEVPATIENPAVLKDVVKSLVELGYAKRKDT
ncbi:propionyl-CoA synthetase [Thermodesulfovibrionales bacterium]|nr:propionyl-CoA synthetase [Thermodesulfovibrionales bacterium]